jgi:nucleoid-associated protein YgaU
MRTLLLVLGLACCFGVAAIWQQQRTVRLREERELQARIAAGDLAMTRSGLLHTGEAVVVLGAPAGEEARVVDEGDLPPDALEHVPETTEGEGPAQDTPTESAPEAELADFVMQVTSGQSLSKIAHEHYGHAPQELVRKLAEYNRMADANELRVGMQLKLPTLKRLGVVLKP